MTVKVADTCVRVVCFQRQMNEKTEKICCILLHNTMSAQEAVFSQSVVFYFIIFNKT